MIWVWVLALAVTTLLVWFWRWGSAPVPIHFNESNTLARVLRVVVMRGVYKGNLRGRLELFHQQNLTPTLIFTKSRGPDDVFGVTATVRRTELPGDQYGRLGDARASRRIAFSESLDGDQACLSIEVRRDFGLALVLAEVVFQDVMGAGLAKDCVGYMRDVLINNHPEWTGVDASQEDLFLK